MALNQVVKFEAKTLKKAVKKTKKWYNNLHTPFEEVRGGCD